MMLSFFSVLLLSLFSWNSYFQPIPTTNYIAHGDLIFVHSDCGTMCDAIVSVTKSKYNLNFNHVGIIQINDADTFVIEAIGKGVVNTPWRSFKIQHANKMYLGTWVDNSLNNNIDQIVNYCSKQIGKPYDKCFQLNNGMYYCSELIYEAVLSVVPQNDIFQLKPMTFKDATTNNINENWQTYFKTLNCPIPEGELGINPGAMSLSDGITISYLQLEN